MKLVDQVLDGMLDGINYVDDVTHPFRQQKARRLAGLFSPAIEPLIMEKHITPDGHVIERGAITDSSGAKQLVFVEQKRSTPLSRPYEMILDFPNQANLEDLAAAVYITRRGWRVGVEVSIGGIYLERNTEFAFRQADQALATLRRVIADKTSTKLLQ